MDRQGIKETVRVYAIVDLLPTYEEVLSNLNDLRKYYENLGHLYRGSLVYLVEANGEYMYKLKLLIKWRT
jgi:hypothetical protein